MEDKTKDFIIKAAKKEFLENGYTGSNLRSIAKEAGVTTGAIYFFFDSKEDLFVTVIRPPLEELKQCFFHHWREEVTNIKNHELTSEHEDIHAAKEIIDIMFRNREVMTLILENREHPFIFSWMEEMVSYAEKHILNYFSLSHASIEPSLSHWLSHIQFERFIYIFEHCQNMSEVEKELHFMIKFMRGGFFALLESSS